MVPDRWQILEEKEEGKGKGQGQERKKVTF